MGCDVRGKLFHLGHANIRGELACGQEFKRTLRRSGRKGERGPGPYDTGVMKRAKGEVETYSEAQKFRIIALRSPASSFMQK